MSKGKADRVFTVYGLHPDGTFEVFYTYSELKDALSCRDTLADGGSGARRFGVLESAVRGSHRPNQTHGLKMTLELTGPYDLAASPAPQALFG